MWIDTFRALGAIGAIAVLWWVLSAVITPYWDALYPMVSEYNNSFSTAALGTLDLLKSIWGGIPLLLIIAAVVWIYIRAQKREPDTYYLPPGGV